MTHDEIAQRLRQIKSNLMHQRRFGGETLGHWRNAAAHAEGDVEELLADMAKPDAGVKGTTE